MSSKNLQEKDKEIYQEQLNKYKQIIKNEELKMELFKQRSQVEISESILNRYEKELVTTKAILNSNPPDKIRKQAEKDIEYIESRIDRWKEIIKYEEYKEQIEKSMK